jgi:hypothetical protein
MRTIHKYKEKNSFWSFELIRLAYPDVLSCKSSFGLGNCNLRFQSLYRLQKKGKKKTSDYIA